jgi:small neutral amino acid transporter SnatA (MarC family)
MSVARYVVAFLAGLLAAPPDAMAQGCAMCYQNAAASGGQGISALQHGILILSIPAIAIFGGILLLLYSRRHVSGQSARLQPGSSETALPQYIVPSHKEMLRP